jgi:hypothetical protein
MRLIDRLKTFLRPDTANDNLLRAQILAQRSIEQLMQDVLVLKTSLKELESEYSSLKAVVTLLGGEVSGFSSKLDSIVSDCRSADTELWGALHDHRKIPHGRVQELEDLKVRLSFLEGKMGNDPISDAMNVLKKYGG